MKRSSTSCLLVLVLPAALVACSGGAPPKPTPAASASAAGAAKPVPVAAGSAAGSEAAASSSASPARAPFKEEDFAESERSRDPFRSFALLFADLGKTRVASKRPVVVARYALDELKLIALVTRTEEPRAMLVDPTGRGWVVVKGQFVGRAELVHAGGVGGVDYELNWRVDRIRESDIVFIREDPAHPEIEPATRVVSLRPERDESSELLQSN